MTLVSEDFAEKVVIPSEEHPGFELTLMHAKEADLDKLASYRPSGIKP
jgi:hypothetical protein